MHWWWMCRKSPMGLTISRPVSVFRPSEAASTSLRSGWVTGVPGSMPRGWSWLWTPRQAPRRSWGPSFTSLCSRGSGFRPMFATRARFGRSTRLRICLPMVRTNWPMPSCPTALQAWIWRRIGVGVRCCVSAGWRASSTTSSTRLPPWVCLCRTAPYTA